MLLKGDILISIVQRMKLFSRLLKTKVITQTLKTEYSFKVFLTVTYLIDNRYLQHNEVKSQIVVIHLHEVCDPLPVYQVKPGSLHNQHHSRQ